MTQQQKKSETAKKLAKDKGKDFCVERAEKGGNAALAKYGIQIYAIMAAKRWAK